MLKAIKQIVTVGVGGMVEVRSSELHEGDRAEVTIIVTDPVCERSDAPAHGLWRRFAGSVNSGDLRAGDNQRIDADLAAEYANQPKTKS